MSALSERVWPPEPDDDEPDLEDAMEDAPEPIADDVFVDCHVCRGRGDCSVCDGSGMVRVPDWVGWAS